MDNLQQYIERLRGASAILAGRARIADPGDTFTFHGRVIISAPPFETEDEYRQWWLPETAVVNGRRIITRAARMSGKEKARYAVLEKKNLLTTNGRLQILNFIGTPTTVAAQTSFAQYFEVGTYPVATVSAGDTTVPSGLARAVPSSAVVAGTQLDIQAFFGAAQAVGTWTNAGLWGVNATGTIGSGTLMTHVLFAYVKANGPTATIDYLINLT